VDQPKSARYRHLEYVINPIVRDNEVIAAMVAGNHTFVAEDSK
jgi:hypothetical protein